MRSTAQQTRTAAAAGASGARQRWLERVLLVTVAALLGAALARFVDQPVSVGAPSPAIAPVAVNRDAGPAANETGFGERPDLSSQLAALDQQLAKSQDDQYRLEQRIAALEEAAERIVAADARSSAASSDEEQSPPGRVPDEVLLQAGISADVVSALRQRLAENEMAKLYLRDQAVREGWQETPEYAEALAELDAEPQALRREFGDDVYDRYLYATGQPNRVMVSSTLVASPAQDAGIHAGDLVVRYGDQRILTLRDLRAATAAGEAGESVSVELRRDGSSYHTSVPRGPLGVRLDLRRVEP